MHIRQPEVAAFGKEHQPLVVHAAELHHGRVEMNIKLQAIYMLESMPSGRGPKGLFVACPEPRFLDFGSTGWYESGWRRRCRVKVIGGLAR